MDFETRKEKFQDGLEKIAAEYGINLYAANIAFPNGEVAPMIKMLDVQAETAVKPVPVKKDEGRAKKRASSN